MKEQIVYAVISIKKSEELDSNQDMITVMIALEKSKNQILEIHLNADQLISFLKNGKTIAVDGVFETVPINSVEVTKMEAIDIPSIT